MSGMDRLIEEYVLPNAELEVYAYGGGQGPMAVMARELLAHRRASQTVPAHEDDLAVDRFAAVMKSKLAKKRNDGRGGWSGPECSEETLSRMLRDHIAKGDPVDVANFAMMLHQRGERIAQAAPAPSDGLREAAATILAVLQDPDSLPIEKHPDWQAIYNAMTADHNESVEISGDSWHDWPSILIAGLEVMAQDSAALAMKDQSHE